MTAKKINICVSHDDYEPIEICTIIVTICGIIGTILITIHASIELTKQKKIQNVFKILFYVSSIFAMLTLITSMTATIFCVDRNQRDALISCVITLGSYFCLLLSLLTTLILRLKYTFDGSVYEVSKTKRFSLVLLYIICMLLCIAAVILLMIMLYEAYNNNSWIGSPEFNNLNWACISLACLGGALYISTAVWACYIFASNLLDIANLRATSMSVIKQIDKNNDNSNGNEISGYELNETQYKLIDSISRYVNLFSIATITSLVTVIVLSSGRWWQIENVNHGQVYMIISSVDALLNLICLYLQYQFNIKYYDKYCQCMERCWKPYFIKKTKMKMYKAHQQQQKSDDQLKPLKVNNDDNMTQNGETK